MRAFLPCLPCSPPRALRLRPRLQDGGSIRQLRHPDMVAKLKEGPDAAAGQAGAGTRPPKACFHKDRWDYAYSLDGAARRSPRTSSPSCFADEKLKSWTVADCRHRRWLTAIPPMPSSKDKNPTTARAGGRASPTGGASQRAPSWPDLAIAGASAGWAACCSRQRRQTVIAFSSSVRWTHRAARQWACRCGVWTAMPTCW